MDAGTRNPTGPGIFVSMKPRSATAALLIALLSGSTGYFLGRMGSPAPSRYAPPVAAAKNPSDGKRKAILAKPDLARLRAELESEKDPLKRFNLALGSLEAWMNADPRGALAWLRSQQPSLRRNEVIRRAIGQFAENDPKGASEWVAANLSGDELNNALIRIAEQWARVNGSEAAAWLDSQPAGRARDAAFEGMMFAWASYDPTAAIAYLDRSQATGELAAILRYAAFAGWAKSDPLNAVAASLQSSRRFDDPGQFANTLANWATVDVSAASAWLLENVETGGERAAAVDEIAAIFAHQSPEAGLEWIGKLESQTEKQSALNKLAAEWAGADPAGAANWAATQQPGVLGDDSLSEILHGFLAEDARAFEAWRSSLPAGPLRQRAEQVGATAGD